MPKGSTRRRRVAPAKRLATVRRYQQCAQFTETVQIHQAECNKLTERVFHLLAQQAGCLDQFIEERGAMRTKAFQHRLCSHTRLDIVRRP
jgi:hypothetical protein